MRALVVTHGRTNSARLLDLPEPALSDGALLVHTIATGVCGTDVETAARGHGWAPRNKARAAAVRILTNGGRL